MHVKFSADLKTAKASANTSYTLSKCFVEAKSQFLTYAGYCSNLLSAQDLLDTLCEHNSTIDVKIKVSQVYFACCLHEATLLKLCFDIQFILPLPMHGMLG